MVQLSHLYMTTGKTIALTMWTFASKLMYLRFNKILEPKKRKSFTVSIFSPSICHEVTGIKIARRNIKMGTEATLHFLILSFKPAFPFFSFTLINRLFIPLHFLLSEWYHLHI